MSAGALRHLLGLAANARPLHHLGAVVVPRLGWQAQAQLDVVLQLLHLMALGGHVHGNRMARDQLTAKLTAL